MTELFPARLRRIAPPKLRVAASGLIVQVTTVRDVSAIYGEDAWLVDFRFDRKDRPLKMICGVACDALPAHDAGWIEWMSGLAAMVAASEHSAP